MPEEHQPVRLTLRWTQQTKDALDAYATAKGLSFSAASEQLLGEAFAARADATLHQGAAPALSDQIQRAIDRGLEKVLSAMDQQSSRAVLEASTARLLATALITYAYGEGEARQAEEACLRVAMRAASRGEIPSLPRGISR